MTGVQTCALPIFGNLALSSVNKYRGNVTDEGVCDCLTLKLKPLNNQDLIFEFVFD